MKGIAKKILTFAAGLLLCSLCFGLQARAEVPTIEPTVLDDFKDETTQVATYEITIPEGQESMVVPMVVKQKGAVYLEYNLHGDVYCATYSDAACTDLIRDGYFYDSEYWDWLEEGTYYLKFYKNEEGNLHDGYYDELTDTYISIWKEAAVTVKAYEYNGEDAVLESGQWATLAGGNDSVYSSSIGKIPPTYCKIVVPKRGYIHVETKVPDEKEDRIDYILCNSKKEELELTRGYFDDADDLAVEKGTYYIKITYSRDPYKLKYTFKSNPNKKNYTKKKATTLKSGKTVYNVFYSKDKKSTWSRWYKIKVTKKKRLTIVYDRLDFPYMVTISTSMFMIYNSKGSKVKVIYDKGAYYTEKKIKAGTYYIRISNPGWNFKTKKRTMGEVWSLQWK